MEEKQDFSCELDMVIKKLDFVAWSLAETEVIVVDGHDRQHIEAVSGILLSVVDNLHGISNGLYGS